ncbi:putative 1-acyl-sn-glycerol-3-phosphate acyltransferase [Fusarium culmorum]|uniref:1-acyl-sn-glycerol-3-phosphate acyltransferase n=1 Tax=Fusarium culmorum TaxID=5516 RepID=A0A2T4H1Q0_FUSCU|nr:putative 1-acyl-sn-glycerol-3-phosphate acyltransferase [Fusarium culmorum]
MSISSILIYFALGYAALTIFFYAMSLVVPQAAFAARGLASYVSLLVVAAYGVFASIFLTLIGKQGIAQWAVGRSFHYLMLYTTGVEFVIEDPDNVLGTTRPAVFVGNHQTELDVLMLGRMFPKYCSVTAKASLKKVPFLGWFMSLSGSIFIDRKNSKDARDAMKGAASEIQSKRQSVYMFPEGTRSYAKEPMLLPFKKGAFHLAVEAGVPIVPCVVANYSHVLYPRPSLSTLERSQSRVFLKPIPTKGLTAADVEELTRTTRELMLNELVTVTAKARGQPMAVPASLSDSTCKSSAIDTNGSAQ